MKLYYTPGACSMASHITARELNLPVDIVRVDLKSRTTESGADYLAVNPEGYVPTLQFDDGSVMTESVAILQYLADTAGASTMLPPTGDLRRYRVVELLSYLSSELHQKLGPLLNPAIDAAARAAVHAKIHSRLGRLEGLLADAAFLTGADFTIADAYALAILGACQHFGVPLGGFPKVGAYLQRLAARPSVLTMLKEEGLLQ